MKKISSDRETVEALLEKTPPDILRSLLCEEMERSPEMKARFLARYGQKGVGKSVSDYKREIDDLYGEEDEYGYVPFGRNVNFSSHRELAEIHKKKGNFIESARIYQALTEVIANRMDSVDDSDGHYGDEFKDYLAEFPKCIKAADPDEAAKKGYISYLFEMYLKRDPDYFQGDYREAIKALAQSLEDFRYWKDLQEKHLPEKMPDKDQWRSYRGALELISSHLQLLSDLGEMAEFYTLIKKHYRSSEDLCLWYARQLLKDGDREAAMQVAEEGLTIFPRTQRDLREFLSGIYRGGSPEKHKEILLALFLDGKEWKHYEQLKKASSEEEWQSLFAQILEHFSRSGSGRTEVIEIYLREKMYNEALKEVLAAKSLSVLERYQSQLGDRNQKEYFDAYRDLIIPFASSRTGRDHYQDVVRLLWRMKRIEGPGGALQEIVERLRRENARKPAFIDEMREL